MAPVTLLQSAIGSAEMTHLEKHMSISEISNEKLKQKKTHTAEGKNGPRQATLCLQAFRHDKF